MITCRLCKGKNISLIHKGTRDRSEIDVLKCNECGLVFLSEIAIANSYYNDSKMHMNISFDEWRKNTFTDDERRFLRYKNLLNQKRILDFGCGNGGFLNFVKNYGVKQAIGVDLDRESVQYLNQSKIECYENLSELPDVKFDIVFMFHVIEHLQEPEIVLQDIFKYIADNGVLIIETPNSDDALLSLYHCQKFADFTYWSPHIYLYNENTLTKLLTKEGFKIIESFQEQRYSLANHLRWLSKGLPGGGIVDFQELNDPELNNRYAQVLRKQKVCDTLTFIIGRS